MNNKRSKLSFLNILVVGSIKRLLEFILITLRFETTRKKLKKIIINAVLLEII